MYIVRCDNNRKENHQSDCACLSLCVDIGFNSRNLDVSARENIRENEHEKEIERMPAHFANYLDMNFQFVIWLAATYCHQM